MQMDWPMLLSLLLFGVWRNTRCPKTAGGKTGMRMQKRIVLGMRFAALLVCGLIAGAWMTTPVAGQSGLGSGRVEGTVTDESGATIADATVTARSDATSVTTEQTTDTSGHFLFPYLTPG